MMQLFRVAQKDNNENAIGVTICQRVEKKETVLQLLQSSYNNIMTDAIEKQIFFIDIIF
jgi:hypothetical protein